jgi:hypothetical protein
MAVLYRHVHTPPRPLADVAPDVPAPVCEWAEWLLQKAPAERPASAAAASQALEEIAVDELGPYWRRTAAIKPDQSPVPTLATAVVSTDTPVTPATRVMRRPRRRRALLAGAALAAAGAATAVVLVAADGTPPPDQPGPERRAAAAPYDFDGNGQQELVLGMPGSGPSGAGVVATWSGGRTRSVLTPEDVQLRKPLTGAERFGTSLASSDFNRDGYADLAVSVPGRALVTVIFGTPTGLKGGRVQPIGTSEMRLPEDTGRFGSRLVGADFNGDEYGDLVVGAPGADPDLPASGSLQILFGSADGVRTSDARLLPRPGDLVQFGTKLRAGDVDGDGHLDLVEGAPDTPSGHLTFCPGAENGPTACSVVSESLGTSGLAVADVTGDGRDDIIQGDHVVEQAVAGAAPSGGVVRIWRGRRNGPASRPTPLTQAMPNIPGLENAGDAFGFTVDTGDLDGDDFADIIVGVPGDDGGAGSLAIIHGGRLGYARGGNTRFHKGFGVDGAPQPGDRLGWAVSALDLTGDDRVDVAASIPGATRLRDAVFVLERTKGVFAPDDTNVVWPLRGLAGLRAPDIASIRLGRADGT